MPDALTPEEIAQATELEAQQTFNPIRDLVG